MQMLHKMDTWSDGEIVLFFRRDAMIHSEQINRWYNGSKRLKLTATDKTRCTCDNITGAMHK